MPSFRSSILVLAAALGLATAAAAALPVADAGDDQTIDCALKSGAQVTLDGTGSSDPDSDPLTYSWANASLTVLSTEVMPTLLLPTGVNVITLTVDDGNGGTATDTVTITVNPDVTPPVLVLASESDSVWPPNHKLHGYDVLDLVESVSDDCSDLTKDDVVFDHATSDEADDAHGDGATAADVQFGPECRRAWVRAERSGGGDGRVYELVLQVEDDAGNSTAATFLAEVPHDQSHGHAAIDGGDLATYTSDCGSVSSCAPVPDFAGCTAAVAGSVSLTSTKKGPRLSWHASGFPAGSVSAEGSSLCAYVNGAPVGGSAAPDQVKVNGKKGKGALSLKAGRKHLVLPPLPLASGAQLRLELHDAAGGCVAHEEQVE